MKLAPGKLAAVVRSLLRNLNVRAGPPPARENVK
jgi:hypothetical protein